MVARFQAHAAPGAALMFTSGDVEGVAIGELEGDPLSHGSLSEAEYRALLETHGFDVAAHVAQDPTCGHRGGTRHLFVRRVAIAGDARMAKQTKGRRTRWSASCMSTSMASLRPVRARR